MKKLTLVLLMAVPLSLASASLVQATGITVGNTAWYAFCAGYDPAFPNNCSQDTFAVGSFFPNSAYPGAPAWTYNAATATEVRITDTSSAGDMYRLYDFGLPVGYTSAVGTAAIGTNNPTADADFADPLLSHGLFTLAPGAHSLTIEITQNAQGNLAAIGFFRVDPASPIPEPGSMILLGTGLLGAVRAYRKRRS